MHLGARLFIHIKRNIIKIEIEIMGLRKLLFLCMCMDVGVWHKSKIANLYYF